jgi:hypothetical protein
MYFFVQVRKLAFLLLFFSALTLWFVSCTSVRLIQDYDEITDNRITALQEKTSRFFVKMERHFMEPQAVYEKNMEFYEEVKVDLNVLEVRNRAMPKSDLTVQQLQSVQKQFDSLEKLHKLGIKSYEELVPARQAIESSFSAMMQLQMSLKNRVKN